MKLVFKNNKFNLYEDKEYEEIKEGIGDAVLGALLGFSAGKIKNKVDFSKYNLYMGDNVTTIKVDAMRQKRKYKGILTFRGNKPYVTITSGPTNVGELVPWTPEWIKD